MILLVAAAFLALFLGFVVADDANSQDSETYEFKSETAKLMDIIVNSLYSNRDIFLRELLSNAADALEKARFVSLKYPGILGEGEGTELKARVWFNKELKELYIQDSGIGMDKEELINNLGTIAESGTKRFLEQQGQSADATTDLIGQFGVGFFSAYLVADEVYVDTIRTPKSDEDKTVHECLRWTSNAIGTYTIEPSPINREEIIRGTRLTLKMKDDALEFLDFEKLKNLILEHSKFLPFPIFLRKEEEVKKDEKVEKEGEEDNAEEEARTPEIKYTWVHVNDVPVLWIRDKNEITKDEYKEFFKNGGLGRNNYEDPAGWIHFKGEGITDYTVLVYIPKTNPLFFMFREDSKRIPGLRLHINRVFVTDKLEIVPEYFSFASGVLDTDNKLTINLSREMIQHSKQMTGIGKKITKKIFEWISASSKKDELRWEKYERNLQDYEIELKSFEENKAKKQNETESRIIDNENEDGGDVDVDELKEPEMPVSPVINFFAFYANYGDYLKYGVAKDDEYKNDLIKSLRYPSTYTIKQHPETVPDLREPFINVVKAETVATFTTLKKYVQRMEKRNEKIINKLKETAEITEEEFDESKAEPFIQKDIYCFIAPTFSEALASPMTERAQALGIEVLYFTNPIDGFMIEPIGSFKGHKLVEISSSDAKLPELFKGLDLNDDENKEEGIDMKGRAAELIKTFLAEELSENIEEVKFSDRLTSSPALLTMKYSNAAMRRVAVSSVNQITRTSIKKGKYMMEINIKNHLIIKLARSLEELNEGNEGKLVASEPMKRFAHSLLDAAMMQSGFAIDDIRAFSDRVYGLLGDTLEREE